MTSTNLTDFRNQYLTKVRDRLTAADVGNASDADLILQSALLKAFDSVNHFDTIVPEAVAPLELMTGAELEVYLQDVSNRQSFELVLASPEAMRAIAASSAAVTAICNSQRASTAMAASVTAMTAMTASTIAMNLIAASTTALNAIIAVISALNIVIASTTAMTAIAASTTAMNLVAASSIVVSAVIASSSALNIVVASITAMTAMLNNTVSRGAIWASATAMNAIQSAPSAVLDALQTHPQTSSMSGSPSVLTGTFITGKSMILRVRNSSGSDTNYLRALAGGSGTGNDIFNTTTAWQTRVRAYNNLNHYSYLNDYIFQAYIVNMN